MGRYATDTGSGNFTPAPVGNYVARCIKLIDLGTQRSEYQGKPIIRSQVLVIWELLGESFDTDSGPMPYTVSKFYTNSLADMANLRADLINWRGRDFNPEELAKFDLQSILGAPCMVNVTHTDKGKAKVTSVAKLPKGMQAPEPVNAPMAFWLDEFDTEKFESLSDKIKEMIKRSPEFAQLGKPRSQPETSGAMDDFDSDVPF